MNNSNGMSTGAALLMTLGTLLIIGMIISAGEPKCSMSGCDNDAKDDSRYCYLHDMSYRIYGTPDYHEVRRNSKNNSNSTNVTSSPETDPKRGSSKNSSSYDSYDSYDAGYEDIYFDDDYDQDRYDSDPDYANGVDDAMDEEDW